MSVAADLSGSQTCRNALPAGLSIVKDAARARETAPRASAFELKRVADACRGTALDISVQNLASGQSRCAKAKLAKTAESAARAEQRLRPSHTAESSRYAPGCTAPHQPEHLPDSRA